MFNVLSSQRGAMFGLDARIALAIFGGLSVVAGTAVFGALRETGVTALVSEMSNLSKGYTEFVLNTGIHPRDGTFADLITDPGAGVAPGWDGPYTTLVDDQHLSYGTYDIHYGTLADNNVPAACGASGVCYSWLELDGVPTATLIDVDVAIDGTGVASPATGSFRIGGAASDTAYFRLQRNR